METPTYDHRTRNPSPISTQSGQRKLPTIPHTTSSLTITKPPQNSKILTKRFPLAEFHSPYIPDQDRQELPNSVVLDFKDGSTLQCSCEHADGQAEVLQGYFLPKPLPLNQKKIADSYIQL